MNVPYTPGLFKNFTLNVSRYTLHKSTSPVLTSCAFQLAIFYLSVLKKSYEDYSLKFPIINFLRFPVTSCYKIKQSLN